MSDKIILIEKDNGAWLNPIPARWEGKNGRDGASGGTLTLTADNIHYKPRKEKWGETTILIGNIRKIESTSLSFRSTLKIIEPHTESLFIVNDLNTWITQIRKLMQKQTAIRKRASEKQAETEKIRIQKETENEFKREKMRDLEEAKRHEKLLEFEEAAEIYKKYRMDDEVIRVRKKTQSKIDQTIIKGDQITKTEIKDSVVSKSNIGSGGDDKLTKIKELKELHDAGAIDDAEFKQMKKEILK